ncbi:unnamed protein product [Adineta ricciae]|uniref:WAP domain-containing protein n=1 Tax=Adineta ricciae TaxID=249248 RepID=A0A814PRC2_ADIRI|nr:unnamed protein product [Adineta ricciae]
MRFLALISLVVLICYSTALSLVPDLQQAHAGFCPMHTVMCAIYCPPTAISLFPRQIGGCRADNECAAEEKCCRPACGCTNRCTKSVAKPGFQKFP